MQEDEEREEKTEIRHTISAEETFTLAKDVYDIRCFIKNVYSNRAVIKRRLNLFSLSVSIVFTLFYLAFIVYASVTRPLQLGAEITIYILVGLFGVMACVLLVATLFFGGYKAESVHKLAHVLGIFRICSRVVCVIISIAALALNYSNVVSTGSAGFNVTLTVVSALVLVIQLIMLFAGGTAGFVRWLLSPVKVKMRFSYVALEWYELASDDKSKKKDKKKSGDKKVKKVADEYADKIGKCLDEYIIPALGKKYVTSIKPAQILSAVEASPEDERHIVGGTFKSVFEYAEQCGYVNINPCRDLQLASIEEEKKQKKSVKSRLFQWYARKKLNEILDDSAPSDGES